MYPISDFSPSDFPTPITGLTSSYNNGIVNITLNAVPYGSRHGWKVIDDNAGGGFLAPANNANVIWTPIENTNPASIDFEFLNDDVVVKSAFLRPYGLGIGYLPKKVIFEGSHDGVTYEPISEVLSLPDNPYGQVYILTHYTLNPLGKSFKHIKFTAIDGTPIHSGFQLINDLYFY